MSALLIVPPLAKYLAGPPAGPAALAGAGRAAGFAVDVVDLNAQGLAPWHRPEPATAAPTGDHCKPGDRFRDAEALFLDLAAVALDAGQPDGPGIEGVRELRGADFDRVERAAAHLASAPWGRTAASQLAARARPGWVGLSVMWSDQVLFALASTLLVRQVWPDITVVWGGAHVTALAPEIAEDARYGRLVDGFVAGYAEQTFVQMLRDGPLTPEAVFQAGASAWRRADGDVDAIPWFGDLAPYGSPKLVLPAWLGRGCVYGRCSFCTYPAVEGTPTPGGWRVLDAVVALAADIGADVALKDALLTAARLDGVAARVDGRVRWAACTRVTPAPTRERLAAWVRAGLSTVELGVESVNPATLRRLNKTQGEQMLRRWLDAAADLDVMLVLNVMTGLPGTSPAQEEQDAATLTSLVQAFPSTRVAIQESAFQLERRAPLAHDPRAHGLKVTASGPWSSVLEVAHLPDGVALALETT